MKKAKLIINKKENSGSAQFSYGGVSESNAGSNIVAKSSSDTIKETYTKYSTFNEKIMNRKFSV